MQLLTKMERYLTKKYRQEIQLEHVKLLEANYTIDNYYVGYLVLTLLNHDLDHTLARIRKHTPQDSSLKITQLEREAIWLNYLIYLKREKHSILEKSKNKIAQSIEQVVRRTRPRERVNKVKFRTHYLSRERMVILILENYQKEWVFTSQQPELMSRLHKECCLASNTFEEELTRELNQILEVPE